MLLGAALCAAGVARPLLQHYVFYISPIFVELPLEPGHAVAQLVGALRYKPEGRGFDSRWFH